MGKFGKCSLFFAGLFILSFLFPFSKIFAETDIYGSEDDGIYHISEDTVWTKDNSPYVIHQDISVDDSATLTIEPGTVVKIESGIYFDVFGKLLVNGTADNRVYFTSFYDDSVGGDTNGDGGASLPENSKWGGFEFIYGGSYDIKNASISYAKEAIEEYSGDGTIDFTTFSNCNNGIFIYESPIDIKDSTFQNISGDVITAISNSTMSMSSSTIKNTGDIFSIFNNSFATISHSTFENIISPPYNSAVEIFNNSSITIADSNLENISAYSAIESFNYGSLTLSGSTIRNVSGISAIASYNCNDDPSSQPLKIENSSIDGGNGIGLYVFCNVEASIKNSKITNFSGDGVQTFSGANINISDSEISGNKNGIESWGANVEVKNSSITNNTSFGVYNTLPFWDDYDNVEVNVPSIKAVGNWWGDASGPFNAISNASGTANQVSENVDYSPWLVSDPNKKKNPVIIIPGIMGTEIYKKYDDRSEIWPDMGKLILSFTDSFLDNLSFKTDGTENPDFPVTLGDIVRKVDVAGKEVSNSFDGLISTLTSDGYTEGKDLFVFPYDWRKSDNDDAVLLKNKIDEVLSKTGASKVDIIAHSMGGLIAQKYIADNGGDKVDKLFFIGTPHLGAPKAFKALMYGDDMGINELHYSILYPPELKMISQNFPSVFDLLPSRAYIDGNPNAIPITSNKYIYDTTASTSKWLNYDETRNFMINHGINSALFPQAESLHDSTDSFDMKGVDVYNFSGCGLTKTIGGITAKKKRSWTSLWLKVVDDYSIDYTNGDETVPLISAVGPFDNHNYYVKSAVHSELPSVSGVPETIFSLLSGNKTPTFSNVSTSSDFCDVKGIVLSTHSPVAINIYDNSGNHTGPTDTGDIEYGLSDISYDKILDDTFAFIPDDNQNYMLLIKPVATDTSAYDLSLENVGSNNKKTRKTYWNKIPVKTTSSNSQIFFSSTSTDYLIKVDEDGDGIFESTSSPSSILASSTAEDIISPQTIVLISQDGTVSLSATDDNAGVLETEYSLDGNTWNLYTAPFSASGNTVSYFSTDNAGNVETPQSIVVPEPVKRGTKRRSISIIGTSTQDTSSASIFISGVQNQNYSEATLQPISLIQNIQQLSTSSSRASSSTIKISNRRTPRKTMRTFVATTSSQSVSPSNLNLTASVANSGSNLGSIIGVFFQKIWTHLFLFFKKIL